MTNYHCSRHLVCVDPEEMVVYHKITGERHEVSDETIKLLSLFEKPSSIEEILDQIKLNEDERIIFTEFISLLIQSGLIVEENKDEVSLRSHYLKSSLVQRPQRTMFSCPTRDIETLSGEDIVFIGSPFDLGATGLPGARYAPDKMRELSSEAFEYHAHIQTGKSLGWFSHESNRNILDTVSMGDLGNVLHHVGEGFDSYFERVKNVMSLVLQNGSFPVTIGGDHSVSYATVSAFAEQKIGVIHIDAHTDLGTYLPEIPNNHGNVFSRLKAESKFETLVQLGIRSFAGELQESKYYAAISAKQIRSGDHLSLISSLDKAIPYYLSLDIDVVDPAFAPGTGTPVPGGLSGIELMTLVSQLAQNLKFVGCDIVEVNPLIDNNNMTSLLANEVLLHFLGEVFR